MVKRLLIFGLAFFFLFCDKKSAQKDVVDLLPLDNEISGWVRIPDTQRIAENATQLYELIDGEGQVHIDNGFVKSAFQKYAGDISGAQIELELRIFDMGNNTNAKNVYDALETGSETPWTDNSAGVEARIDESPLFAYKIDFWDNKFYVWITIEDKSDAALAIAKLFALNVSTAIREEHSSKRIPL